MFCTKVRTEPGLKCFYGFIVTLVFITTAEGIAQSRIFSSPVKNPCAIQFMEEGSVVVSDMTSHYKSWDLMTWDSIEVTGIQPCNLPKHLYSLLEIKRWNIINSRSQFPGPMAHDDGDILDVYQDSEQVILLTTKDLKVYDRTMTKMLEGQDFGYIVREGKVIFSQGQICLLVDGRLFTGKPGNMHEPGNGLSFKTIAKTQKDEVLLSAMDGRLYVLVSGQLKRYYVPGVTFPQSVDDIICTAQTIWMKAGDGNLYSYDNSRQVMRKMGFSVDDFCVDAWNAVWAISGDRILYDNTFASLVPPEIFIRHIKGVNNIEERDSLVEVSVKGGALLVPFHGFGPDGQSGITYSYRVGDGLWQKLHSDGYLFINDLARGTHRLQLRATHDGRYFGYSKPIMLNNSSSIFQTPWPYFFGTLGLFFLVALISLGRHRQRESSWRVERDKLRLELELLQARQKTLQLKMNPHFIFNAMNSIKGLIALNENRKARQYLGIFSELLRTVLEKSEFSHISVREELKFIKGYLELEQLSHPGKFVYEISVDDDIADDDQIPAMVLQPFAENAIVHGFRGYEKGGQIKVNLMKAGGEIVVDIIDNGVGRYVDAGTIPAKRGAGATNGNHLSLSTRAIMERLSKLHGGKDLERVIYEDLKDENSKALGTKVSIRLPIKKRHGKN